MKQKIIDKKNYPRKCSNCLYGRTPLDNRSVLCEKKGEVDPEGSCRRYKYDPLKRIPAKPILDTDYSPEDFQI